MRMGRGLRLLLAVAGAAVLVVGVSPGPAQAAPAPAAPAPAAPAPAAPAQEMVKVQGASAAAGCQYTKFGYTGTFMCGTLICKGDWDGDGAYDDEAFGIAPSRTIWHAWPGSGGWKEMPNNGRADDMWNCYRNGKGQRQVEVWTANNNVWYSYYSGGWKGWYYYPGS